MARWLTRLRCRFGRHEKVELQYLMGVMSSGIRVYTPCSVCCRCGKETKR
jgi:hypothetical protein